MASSPPTSEVASTVPLVVRLEGTNVELGKKILAESGLADHSAKDMADAARQGGGRSRARELTDGYSHQQQ